MIVVRARVVGADAEGVEDAEDAADAENWEETAGRHPASSSTPTTSPLLEPDRVNTLLEEEEEEEEGVPPQPCIPKRFEK